MKKTLITICLLGCFFLLSGCASMSHPTEKSFYHTYTENRNYKIVYVDILHQLEMKKFQYYFGTTNAQVCHRNINRAHRKAFLKLYSKAMKENRTKQYYIIAIEEIDPNKTKVYIYYR